MKNEVKKKPRWSLRRGAATVEWIVVATIIAIVSITAFTKIQSAMKDKLSQDQNAIQGMPTQ